MKKIALILGMIACILCLSACGSENVNPGSADSSDNGITEEDAVAYGEQLVKDIDAIVQGGMEAQFEGDTIITAAFDSWKSAQTDMGSYQNIIGSTAEIGADSTVITVTVSGTLREAEVEILLDKDLALTSVTTNVTYSFGELMTKALMNTAIGMGTVFVVLILISFIISAFVFIPKIQAAFSKKGAEPEPERKEAVVSTPAPVPAVEEELTDDLELVAVIAAAIAASEGASSTDGFVVRSIRKAGTNKWQRA